MVWSLEIGALVIGETDLLFTMIYLGLDISLSIIVDYPDYDNFQCEDSLEAGNLLWEASDPPPRYLDIRSTPGKTWGDKSLRPPDDRFGL